MPPPGRIGAISAANRRNRQRSQGSLPTACQASMRNVERPRAAPTKELPPSHTISCASTDTKQSVLTRFKSQVSETSSFFKKQHRAFTDKLAKGLRMASGMKSAQRRDTVADVHESPTVSSQSDTITSEQRAAALDPSWVTTLEDMGFTQALIIEAVSILGRLPDELDDLLQVLSVMSASPHVHEAPPALSMRTDTRFFPSQDTVIDPAWLSTLEDMGFIKAQVIEAVGILGVQPDQIDDLLQVLSVMNADSSACDASQTPMDCSVERQADSSACDASQTPMDCSVESSRDRVEDLASAVVASAVAKAAVSLGWQQDENVMAKAHEAKIAELESRLAEQSQVIEAQAASEAVLKTTLAEQNEAHEAKNAELESRLAEQSQVIEAQAASEVVLKTTLAEQNEAMEDKSNHHSSPIVGGA